MPLSDDDLINQFEDYFLASYEDDERPMLIKGLRAVADAAAADQREQDARIAESRYFGGGSVGSANRWGAKQAAAAIRAQGASAGTGADTTIAPEWEYATTTGPRKTWDNEMDTPPGDGWEIDRDRGRDGWERFDYHEERYWKRRTTEGQNP